MSLAAALEANAALVELDLSGCAIGSSGAAALGKALRSLGTLQTLRCAPLLTSPGEPREWGGALCDGQDRTYYTCEIPGTLKSLVNLVLCSLYV